MTKKNKSLLGKFLKGAIASGITQVGIELSTGYSISSLVDAVHLAKVVLLAFVTGVLLAGYKYFTWKK